VATKGSARIPQSGGGHIFFATAGNSLLWLGNPREFKLKSSETHAAIHPWLRLTFYGAALRFVTHEAA
jgi:hypothetical protein